MRPARHDRGAWNRGIRVVEGSEAFTESSATMSSSISSGWPIVPTGTKEAEPFGSPPVPFTKSKVSTVRFSGVRAHSR